MATDLAPFRSDRSVLVAGAETVASVGVIRSLGRAGYEVHACSDRSDALGFRSRYAAASTVHPDPHSPAFSDWLRRFVRDRGIDMIVPTETLLVAIRPELARFAPLLPVSRSGETVYRGMSKYDTLRCLQSADCTDVRSHFPPTLLVDADGHLPRESQLAELGCPLFIKTDAAYARTAMRSLTVRVESAQRAHVELGDIERRFSRAIVQGFVPGQGVGAFFLMHEGEVLAEFMHRRLHEVPHTGGVSSLRESWYHEAIRNDALAKLRALDWEGVAMMEYRWNDATDDFRFIEMNGRFWGSLHLALAAGVDFPVILADTFFGNPPASRAPCYPIGLRCRHTFPKEVQYVWSRWKDRALPLSKRVADLIEFSWLSLDPRVRSDMNFPGDRSLWRISLVRWLRELGGLAAPAKGASQEEPAHINADPATVQL